MKYLLIRFVLPLFLLVAPQSAWAEVVVTFYSHELGSSFPHAFFTVKGKIDATGQEIDDSHGFTAANVTPALLWGSVKGKMEKPKPKYIASSDARFSITINDAQYETLNAFIAKWAAEPQKNYNLNKRNCIHFVMEAAATLGLNVNRESKFFKKPRSFLEEVKSLNPSVHPPVVAEAAAAS